MLSLTFLMSSMSVISSMSSTRETGVGSAGRSATE